MELPKFQIEPTLQIEASQPEENIVTTNQTIIQTTKIYVDPINVTNENDKIDDAPLGNIEEGKSSLGKRRIYDNEDSYSDAREYTDNKNEGPHLCENETQEGPPAEGLTLSVLTPEDC